MTEEIVKEAMELLRLFLVQLHTMPEAEAEEVVPLLYRVD